MHHSLIRRVKLFDFHAKHLWRFHRLLVRKHLVKRCVSCAISAAYTNLDGSGLCQACRTYKAQDCSQAPAAREAAADLATEMDQLFRQYAGKGAGAYDALVMLSGGKDSAFLIHVLQQRYPKLRILALTIDNSFMSPIALQNCVTITEKLNVALVTLKAAKSLYAKSFRLACTLKEQGKGAFETVDRIDADLGFSQAKIFAAQNRIPLLLSGLSWVQVELLFAVKSFEVPQAQALKKVTTTLGKDLREIYEPGELNYWWDPDRVKPEAWPRFIHPFYVWRYEEQEIRDSVIKLGLIKPGHDNPLLTNNVLIPMMVAADYLRLGYASFEPEFARLVREGKAERLFWRNVFEMLEYSAKTGWMLEREIDKLVQSLGLTRRDVGLQRLDKGAPA